MTSLFQNKGGKSNQGLFFVIARVTHVVYGPYLSDGKTPDPDYKSPVDIGKIRYIIDNSKQNSSKFGAANKPARPAWTSFQHYPTENEYVYLIPGPSPDKNTTSGAQELFYLPPFGMWGAVNHNAFPALDEYATLKTAEALASQEVLQGTPNSQGDVGIEMPLGNSFQEKQNVRNLRSFVGDVTIEGRWGNSIRFGSSLSALKNENNWAASNQDGDPITIIRNGQGALPSKNPWDPIVENINTDGSSIYLTSGQQILIDDVQKRVFPLASFRATFIATEGTSTKTIPATLISNQTISPNAVDDVNNIT